MNKNYIKEDLFYCEYIMLVISKNIYCEYIVVVIIVKKISFACGGKSIFKKSYTNGMIIDNTSN